MIYIVNTIEKVNVIDIRLCGCHILLKRKQVHVMKQDEFKNFTLNNLRVKRTVDTKNESFQ